MKVFACTSCAQVDFPRRLLCPACGTDEFVERDAPTGCIEEITLLHHRPGNAGGAQDVLATVRTCAGPRVVARLHGAAAPGDTVALDVDGDGALVARAAPGA
jgi:uncharacterized protein